MTRLMTTMALAALVLTAAARAEETAPSFVNEGIVNAPVAEVWKVWSTSEGYRLLGPALADVDLRIGGLIRARYAADGALGDAETIENEILAYEPQRMIAIRIRKPPATFPFKDAWKRTWTVITLTPLPDGRTQVRGASLGYGSDPESQRMKVFFERGNELTIQTLAARFAR